MLDEPVSGLDPEASSVMYSLIHELNRNKGLTVIIITHDLEAALKYATHILRLKDGEGFFGTKEEFLCSTS